MPKIEACPFCESTRVKLMQQKRRITHAVMHNVWCPECAARGPVEETKEDAIGRWNNSAYGKGAT